MSSIELEWPERVLNPNDRSHWTKKSKARAEQKTMASAKTLLLLVKEPYQLRPTREIKIPLFITFHCPTKRHFDLDNHLASMKGAIDGLAYALDINDKQFEPITLKRGEPGKPGKVVIEW